MHGIKHSSSRRKLPVRHTLQTVCPASTKQWLSNIHSMSTVDKLKLATIKIFIMCAGTVDNKVRHLSEALEEYEAKCVALISHIHELL